ncbi:hypothetical protein DL240_14720 [Lujinxingia litoralis]|uniref:Autotransporter domain-containing protein n=1 Tax=Lujinxingia litoralis TaxID=2211119 RepID=A0A328C2P6_9DELT|nr:hypothetical protein [Lujinxingia litoralis]RAL20925.1 hypothetical protein DL240_14720 [Lujinxingia litoralis]
MRRTLFCIALGTLSLLSQSAWAERSPQRAELQAVEACASAEQVAELQRELKLRLPELHFFRASRADSRAPDWQLFWVPAGRGECAVLLRTHELEHRATLGPDASAEQVREAASRLAWVITASRSAARDAAHQQGQTHATQVLARARQLSAARHTPPQPDALASTAARESAGAIARHTLQRARHLARTRQPPALATSTLPAALTTPTGPLRLGVVPGLSVGSSNPSLSLNIIGSHAHFEGAEVGLLNHLRERGAGAQMALGANWVDGSLHGVQMASLLNYAAEIQGAQLSPLVNISERQRGVQVGMVNVAGRLQGTQLGLVNVSEDASWPVGLVNIATAYPPRAFAHYALPGHLYAGVSMGGRRLRYLLQWSRALSGGIDALGGGLGLHLPFEGRPYFGDIALVPMLTQLNADVGLQTHLRALAGYRFSRRFALVAGPSFNYYRSSTSRGHAYGSPIALMEVRQSDGLYQLWVDLMVGVVF